MASASSTFQTPQSGPLTTRTDEELAPGDIAVGVVIGRASEYFDFFVFGIAAVLVFPHVFFPFVDTLTGTLYAFLVFALAFLVRPIGTLIGMEIQRRFGRSAKLTAALFLLGCSTVGMGLLPSYADAGNTAIVLLALCRVGQGLALGGSWDGLPSLLALNAPPHQRGWYAMLGQLGAPPRSYRAHFERMGFADDLRRIDAMRDHVLSAVDGDLTHRGRRARKAVAGGLGALAVQQPGPGGAEQPGGAVGVAGEGVDAADRGPDRNLPAVDLQRVGAVDRRHRVDLSA